MATNTKIASSNMIQQDTYLAIAKVRSGKITDGTYQKGFDFIYFFFQFFKAR